MNDSKSVLENQNSYNIESDREMTNAAYKVCRGVSVININHWLLVDMLVISKIDQCLNPTVEQEIYQSYRYNMRSIIENHF
jgi:hypothetical protein